MKTKRIRSTHAHVVTCNDGTQILYSYTTPVAVFYPDKGYFMTSEYYSRTTTSHIREFVKGCVGKLTEKELRQIVEEKCGVDFDYRVRLGDVWTNRPTSYGYSSY